jgi:DNA repair exonuclease SbcCD ATPase subunit
MITKIECKNLRGKTGSWNIGQKTLVVGPNGSGKTTLAAAVNLALLGYLPGNDRKDTFANASAEVMSAGVTIGAHTISRTWSQGKTLSETIAVDGASAPKAAAEAMIRLATGDQPQVMDMSAFYAMSATEKRRTILTLVSDGATLDKLLADETKARDALNNKRRDRQAAEKSIEQLTKSLSAMVKPTGNVEMIKKQLAETEALRNETRDKVSKGEANEAAKKQVDTQIKSMAGYEKKLADAKIALKDCEKRGKALRCEQDILGKPEVVEDVEPLPVRAQEVVKSVIAEMEEPHLVHQCDNMAEKLRSLITSPEAKLKNDLIISEWQIKSDKLANNIANAQAEYREIQANMEKYKAMVGAAQKAEKQIEKIGAGVDEKDRAALTGLDMQITELRSKLNPLLEVAALTKQVEQSKLTAEKALADEETAKKALETALEAQQKVVEAAKSMLNERATEILPSGTLIIEDDGAKELTLSWARDGRVTQRQTLSGAERAIFDAGLGYALASTGLVIIEAAEVDTDNMGHLCKHLQDFPAQILLLTCHPCTNALGFEFIFTDK